MHPDDHLRQQRHDMNVFQIVQALENMIDELLELELSSLENFDQAQSVLDKFRL